MTASILYDKRAGFVERMAAKELRRYWYEIKNQLLPMGDRWLEDCHHLIVATMDKALIGELGCEIYYPQHRDGYIIKRVFCRGKACIVLSAKEDTGLLYAVYHFAEILGARFYLHGDVLPDQPDLSDVFSREMDIAAEPCFSVRGILPFHDFPEGPDWWSLKDYRSVIAQLVKMRANFIGLHTYPEPENADESYTAEPTVWIGKQGEFDAHGDVFNSYPAQHFKTNGGSWGYGAFRTDDYPMEMGKVFSKSVFAADYMDGDAFERYRSDVEEPSLPPGKYNGVFNRYGDLLSDAFGFARKLGVKTCIGVETPLTVPRSVRRRDGEGASATDYYKGIFSRISKKHDLDYFWLWTPESWTWEGNTPEDTRRTIEDIRAALDAKKEVGAPFDLALCGWVLGPEEDRRLFDACFPRDVPFSCINRNVGFDPLEPSFGSMSPDRAKWAIPWLEDDPALTSLQLFVGRMRRDAFDAKRYGCDGIVGIHWRTKAVAPSLKALMNAAWSQQGWSDALEENIRLEGWSGDGCASCATGCDDSIYATARFNLQKYTLRVPHGTYRVVLCFVDTQSQKAGERVFDAIVGKKCVPRIDLYREAGNRPYECAFPNVIVEQDVELIIELRAIKGSTILSGIVIEGMMANAGDGAYSRKINCGGESLDGFEADLGELSGFGRGAGTTDFYLDWAKHEFGEEIAGSAAEILAAQDGRLPRPSHWSGGPGKIDKNPVSWLDLQKEYDFALKFAALEDRVRGKGHRARFRYWKNQMLLLMYCARLGCEYGVFDEAYERKDATKLHMAYDNLYHTVFQIDHCLLEALDTKGDLGVIANLQQRSIIPMLAQCQAKLRERNVDCRDVADQKSALHSARIAVLSANALIEGNEAYRIEFVVIGGCVFPPEIKWKPIGETSGPYQTAAVRCVSGWAYEAIIPAGDITDDFEFSISAVTPYQNLRYPETEQDKGKTVVVLNTKNRSDKEA